MRNTASSLIILTIGQSEQFTECSCGLINGCTHLTEVLLLPDKFMIEGGW